MPNHKGKNPNLGRSLIRKKKRSTAASTRHTSDGVELPSSSITEITSIDEFISNAQAAQRSFETERGRMAIIGTQTGGSDDEDDNENLEGIPEESDPESDFDEESFSSIPKKPDWTTFSSNFDSEAAAEEYKMLENLEFLKWKKKLNKLQHKYPKFPIFEKNLDFWRQLWKIVEISDVIVQVVDARDPLFYQSLELSNYVLEVGEKSSSKKANVLLLNKADFLTLEQREFWCNYFRESDTRAVFFSALSDKTDVGEKLGETESFFNRPEILSPEQTLEALKSLRINKGQPVTVGFLGYPNVGKSSTINRFLSPVSRRRLQVSATPGKTKHYQTHVLDDGKLILVDGPGLVIPNFQMGKAEMILAGILPIDNITDYFSPVELLLTKIDFGRILKFYGIMNPNVIIKAQKSATRTGSEALQLLSAFGIMRGYMKPGGPDHARAARVILKDFCQGKLLFVQAPPNVPQEVFSPVSDENDWIGESLPKVIEEVNDLSIRESFPELSGTLGAHIRGKVSLQSGVKGSKKDHHNAKKREKARRIFAYADN